MIYAPRRIEDLTRQPAQRREFLALRPMLRQSKEEVAILFIIRVGCVPFALAGVLQAFCNGARHGELQLKRTLHLVWLDNANAPPLVGASLALQNVAPCVLVLFMFP